MDKWHADKSENLIHNVSALRTAERLPNDFIIGVGDSDLQVVGEKFSRKEEDSQATMWRQYARESGRVYRNDTPDRAVDRFHRWEEDVDLITSLGFKHYRTSVSWSRLLNKDQSVNQDALEWYQKLFRRLRGNGIRIYATLYHWELPAHIHEEGGWKNRSTAQAFCEHARIAVTELGEWMDEVFILNEPWCSSHNSYFLGHHAPGEGNLRDSLLAAHHLLLAQGIATATIREVVPDLPVGTVYNIEPAFAYTETDDDRFAAQLANEFFNDWFFQPLYEGTYPEALREQYGAKCPVFDPEDMEMIRVGDQLATMGINYYQSKVVRRCFENALGYLPVRLPHEETNELGWSVSVPPIYPEGLRIGLERLHQRYSEHGLTRMLVTENGYAGSGNDAPNSPVLDDPLRIQFHENHLHQVMSAREGGVPVDGYFAWTLLDNYEWAEGYRPEARFGLVHVDRDTLDRAPKASAEWFKGLNGMRAERVSTEGQAA